MKRECPQCGFELRSMNSYEKFVHEKLERFGIFDPQGHGTETIVGFDVWLDDKPGTTRHVPDLGYDVTLVESQVHYDYEYADNAVYLVLQVAGHHFIKHGSRDSYGNGDWEDGEFRAVTKQTREFWEWEDN